jgi:hypothetical protein
MVDSDLEMRRRFSRRRKEWCDTDYDRDAFESRLSDATLVDGHFHVRPNPDGARGYDERVAAVEETIEWMDEHGVDRIVTHPLESPERFDLEPDQWENVRFRNLERLLR